MVVTYVMVDQDSAGRCQYQLNAARYQPEHIYEYVNSILQHCLAENNDVQYNDHSNQWTDESSQVVDLQEAIGMLHGAAHFTNGTRHIKALTQHALSSGE